MTEPRREKVSKKALTRTLRIKVPTRKRVADKVVTTRKALSQTSRALPTSDNVHFEDVINFAPATSNSFFKDDRDAFFCFEMDSIPVSGYTTYYSE